MPSSGAERRQSKRRLLRTDALILFDQAHTLKVRTLDISVEGLAIVVTGNPSSGITFRIRFPIPTKTGGHTTIETQARVVHSIYSSAEDGFAVGLHFVGLPSDSTKAIREYVG